MNMLGKFCENINLKEKHLNDDEIPRNIRISPSKLTKGIAMEIFLFAKAKYSNPIDKCLRWLSQLTNEENSTISKETLKTKLYQVHAKKKKMGGKGAKLFLNEVFTMPMATTGIYRHDSVKKMSAHDEFTTAKIAVKQASVKLASVNYEKILLKRKLKRSQEKIMRIKRSKEEMAKIKDSGIREIKKSLKSKREIPLEILEPEKKRRKLEQDVRKLRKDVDEKEDIIEGLSQQKAEMEIVLDKTEPLLRETKEEVDNVRRQNKELIEENEYLRSLLEDNAPLLIYDDATNSYTSDLSRCVMDLLNCNVSSQNVSKVINIVSRMCGRVPNQLPSRQTVDRISDQKLYVASKQMETIKERENLTMYSDETSKFGRSFEVFAVTDSEKNSYLLGLREMHSKSAATVLDTLKEILRDIDDIAEGTNTGKKILSNIKNTMSDRAATEKKFQHLLEDYRKEILPLVKEGWEEMNDDERTACGSMNNFFCGLHLLVNFADVCAEALLKYENSLQDESRNDETEEIQKKKQNESGTLRLIRTSSKAFARGVDEKSGVHGPFKTYMANKNKKVEFVKFKHNRFNILFLMGKITYHQRKSIEDFLENVHGATNKLLMSVLKDIKDPTLKAGCRALGIISYCVTSPLWRLIENNSHILEMADVYTNLVDFLRKAKEDSTGVINGTLIPFSDVNVEDDLLKEDHETDTTTVQILQWLFEAMLHLLERQAGDHLPGGKFSTAPATIWEQSRSTIKHNKLPEFFFGQLDFLLRYKPNATTLCNEAFLVFSHNKTGRWLNELPDDERSVLLKEAKTEGPKIRKRFQQRMKEIESKRLSAQKMKENELHEKQERLYKRKEKMTNDILFFGLWQSEEEMTQQLQEIKRKTEKVKAVKAQLTFRKTVLHQTTLNKSLFQFSFGKKAKSLDELKANLKVLIDEARKGSTSETKSKKTPLLVLKRIKHKFEDDWYYGEVVSVVPGFTDWYNVKYDNDPAIYVYRLQDDYELGDLLIVPKSAERFLSMIITFELGFLLT